MGTAIISGVTCRELVGSRSRNGQNQTLVIWCDKADAATVFGAFNDTAYYSHIGTGTTISLVGYFQRNMSSIQHTETYSILRLVFSDTQGVSYSTTGGSSVKFDPVYRLDCRAAERPIEEHPDYKAKWNNNLYYLRGMDDTSALPAVPSWYDTDTSADTVHDSTEPGLWRWAKNPPTTQKKDFYYVQIAPKIKPGVEAYAESEKVVQQNIRYKQPTAANADIEAVDKLKAPPETFGLPNTQTCWRVVSATVQEDGKYLTVCNQFAYRPEGWDTDIYELAGSTVNQGVL